MHVKIENIAYYLPKKIEDDNLLQLENPEWDMEKIRIKTGITKRYISEDAKETTTSMAIAASKKIKNFESLKKKIQSIILITQSPEFHLPTSSCIIQEKLDLNKNCMTFDINHGCSGYIYGLSIAGALIDCNIIDNCLLICSEKYSSYIKKNDRNTRTLFSDGAASTLITRSKGKNFIDFAFGTDGSGFDKLIVPKNDLDINGKFFEKENLSMSGADIYTFTISKIPKLVKETLSKNNLLINDIDLFVFHQASKLVLDTLKKNLNIPDDKIYNNYDKVGNTVSASIPIALKDANDDGFLHKGQKVMLVGFGVGLSWGACIINF